MILPFASFTHKEGTWEKPLSVITKHNPGIQSLGYSHILSPTGPWGLVRSKSECVNKWFVLQLNHSFVLFVAVVVV